MSSSNADDLDLRQFRNEALSMVKGASSIDRTLKYGMRTKMRYSYNPKMALGEDSLPANVYTGEKLKHKLRKVTTLPTSNKVELKFDHWGTESLESSPEEYDQKCFFAFKVYAKPVGDMPSVKTQLGLQFSELDETIRLICQIKNIKPVKPVDARYHFSKKELISWKEFKTYVDRIFDRERMVSNARPLSPATLLLQQFQKPVQQPTAQGAMMTPKGLSTPADQQLYTAEVDINGHSLPSGALKDAIGKVYRKEKAFHRGLDAKGSVATGPRTIDSVPSYDTAFTDSTRGSLTRQNTTCSTKNLIGEGDNSLNDSTSDFGEAIPSIYTVRSGMKMRELVNPKEDYLQRWTQMKQKRDQRMEREERRDARNNLLHNFRRLVVNSEASEYQRMSNQQFLYERGCTLARYEETLRMKRQMDYNWKHGKEMRRQRLLEENRYAKETLEQSLIMSRSLHEDSLFEFREDGEMPGMKVGTAGSVDLDQASSSIVHVPQELKQKMQSAKSAKAFEAAKEEIRAYYTRTMSSRISSYTHSRDARIKRAGNAESRVHITPVGGSVLFADSVLSRMTDDLSDDEQPPQKQLQQQTSSGLQRSSSARHYEPVHETNKNFDLADHYEQVRQREEQVQHHRILKQQHHEHQLIREEELRKMAADLSRQQAEKDQVATAQEIRHDIEKRLRMNNSLSFDLTDSGSLSNIQQRQQKNEPTDRVVHLPPIDKMMSNSHGEDLVDVSKRPQMSPLKIDRSRSSDKILGSPSGELLRSGSNRDLINCGLLKSTPPAGKGAVGGLGSPSRAGQRKEWFDAFNRNNSTPFFPPSHIS